MIMPLRVPPKSDATCLVHVNGESNATAQPAAMCGKVSLPPHSSSWQQILHFFDNAVEIGHLVVHADDPALGTGAIVTGYVDEQSIVQLTDFFDRRNKTADLVIGLPRNPA